MRPNLGVLLLFFLVLALAGCARISEEEAKQTAIEFVKSNVIFYSRDPDYRGGSGYNFSFEENVSNGNEWIFLIDVSSYDGNATKKALIRLRVDSSSNKVVGFEQVKQ